MKKSSKILGSIALSAALVMGTAVPAFAADDDYDHDAEIAKSELPGDTVAPNVNNNRTTLNNPKNSTGEDDKGASTIIKASTYTSQLNVTIPLVLPLKFNTVGGAGMAPTDNAYYIKNNSSTDITVTKAEYTIDNGEWGLGSGPIAEGTNPTAGKAVGDVYIKLTPTAGVDPVPLELVTKTANASGKMEQTGLSWGISARNAVTLAGTKYGLKVEPSSSILKKSVDTAVKMASITYTVSVGATNAAGDNSGNNPEGGKTLNDYLGLVPAAGVKATVEQIKAHFNAEDPDFAEVVDEDGEEVTTGDVEIVEVKIYTSRTKTESVSTGAAINSGAANGYQVVVKTVTSTEDSND